MQDYIKWHIIREWFRFTNLFIENSSKTIKIYQNTLEKMKQTLRNFQLLRKTPPSAQSSPSLVISSVGTHGKIQLNRPEALNAVNNDMISEIRPGLIKNSRRSYILNIYIRNLALEYYEKPQKVMLWKISGLANQ